MLILLFLNTTLWMLGTLLFIHLQATNEAEHKRGVRKVQRGFVDDLWQESRIYDELEWKSSARRRIMQFESQIYSAVEAGVTSSSGQNIWSVPNTFVYVFREGFTCHFKGPLYNRLSTGWNQTMQ